jgi:hypothetical protein
MLNIVNCLCYFYVHDILGNGSSAIFRWLGVTVFPTTFIGFTFEISGNNRDHCSPLWDNPHLKLKACDLSGITLDFINYIATLGSYSLFSGKTDYLEICLHHSWSPLCFILTARNTTIVTWEYLPIPGTFKLHFSVLCRLQRCVEYVLNGDVACPSCMFHHQNYWLNLNYTWYCESKPKAAFQMYFYIGQIWTDLYIKFKLNINFLKNGWLNTKFLRPV